MTVPFIDIKAQFEPLREQIEARIKTVLDHCQFILGPEVGELESALAKYVGCTHAITCASGTDASLMAMMALDIGPGDEVIVPAFSFIATAETVLLTGATPVYVDVEADTYNMDAREVEKAITKKTKAIQPVSLYGQTCDMTALNELASQHGIPVIEDAAQSFGATYRGKKSGVLSKVGVTSFFPAKPLGCFGDGGAIFTDDDQLAKTLREIRVHGQESRYYHTRIGINGRLDTLQCAILLPKLERFPWELEQRSRIANRYNQAFAELQSKGIVLPILKEGRTSAWAQYTVQTPNRDDLVKKLGAKGIPTSVHYPHTMCNQPAYKKNGRIVSQAIAERMAKTVLSLPMYPDMPDSVLDQVIEGVLTSA